MPRLPDRKGGGRGSFYIQMCVNCKRRADSRLTQSKSEGCCELCERKSCTLEKEVRLL